MAGEDDFELRYPRQPIDTAPRDGSEVIGILADDTEIFMLWVANTGWFRSLGAGEIGTAVHPVSWRKC
ncbi:hypothetical protein HRJ34_14705 [Rhizorhabdus wittichii]|uniref:Uncharacterized protein n=1 Tax=Rhizorhabdus wittichii TaxID=160791 RepID=A0A975CXJ5_9SPHN|nr:hypothetical protein [Rhizorhabdus wittichii]QTH19625.1 hypothetical protein HRJ34_14705 [Rhizorhabdus wittichii]